MNQRTGWLLVVCFLLPLSALADGPFRLAYGLNGDYWTSNYAQPYTGYEAYLPITTAFQVDPNLNVFAQTELAAGSYTDSYAGPETISLADISDTVLGGTYNFTAFGLKSMAYATLNIPTGNPSWESQEFRSEILTEFVDTHYRGRGWGGSALYGVSLPETKGEYGVAAGLLFAGAFNPAAYQNISTSLNLGNAVFLTLNHIQPDNVDENEVARFSIYYSEDTVVNGQNVFQLGTDFIASYAWTNPKEFSLEVGAQAFLPSQQLDPVTGVFGTQAHNTYAPRFYVTPSRAWGDFVLTGNIKYVMQNDCPTSDLVNYDGGGFLVGLEPSYKINFDKDTSFKIAVSFDDVLELNYGVTNLGARADVNYELWNLNTVYELKI